MLLIYLFLKTKIKNNYYNKGNEGPVEMYYNNSGFFNEDLASHFGALIVYMEHRYFGDSWPFGDEQTSFLPQNAVYLTSLQALYDYVTFLNFIRKVYNCPRETCSVIVTGGSYGAMLASWFRLKFPNVVDGAYAASAPIVQFQNRQGLDFEVYSAVATGNYIKYNANIKIKDAYNRLQRIQQSGNKMDYEMLSKAINTCDPVNSSDDVELIADWMDNAYQYMAMTNYPYDTDFLMHLPPWPANNSCNPFENITSTSADFDLFNAVRYSCEIYYNYDKIYTCNNISSISPSTNDMSGWDVLACADLAMPISSDGVRDMFRNIQWDPVAYNQECQSQFELWPDLSWVLNFYGGIIDEDFSFASNIFFTNGMLDPWSAGGVYLTNSSLNVGHILMPASAHHLDLRLPNAADPSYVVNGRAEVFQYIQLWLNQKSSASSNTKSTEL
eukprot:TRINITY_DN2135_c0_g1_i3.p1 TRINITY_DN2135_c0_g1~~TRINITY_DN2135_c0_g1_i3.p1  ORF type:complete len:442 (+),score=68.37 TRINITY_DN2135_c0_g1_i3:540-1865(+)